MESLRRSVAECTRALTRAGILNYSGHVSARTGEDGSMLIIAGDTNRRTALPDDVIQLDGHGRVVGSERKAPIEAPLHRGVYRSRADVAFVCHGHPPLGAALSATDAAPLALRHFSHLFAGTVRVHRDVTHIRTDEQAHAVARTLGDSAACLLRSHGTVVVASSIEQLLMRCIDLEMTIRTQIDARLLGNPLPLTPDEVAALELDYGDASGRARKMWAFYTQTSEASIGGAV